MVDIKLLVVACAAFVFVWRVFYKKRQEEEIEEDENLFRKHPHDIILSMLSTNSIVVAKFRTSFTQKLITIGRLDFNTIALSSPLISGEHAVIKWCPADNHWMMKDIGSTNGTRLNDLVISSNRQKSEEYPLRHGDVIILAEDIRLVVSLTHPGPVPSPTPTPHRGTSNSPLHESHLKLAPRRGILAAAGKNAKASQLITVGEEDVVVETPRPNQVEYRCDSIEAEFAFLTQVGLDHIRKSQSSEDVVFWECPLGHFSQSAMFGVCDGHLGSEVSRAIAEQLPQVFCDLISTSHQSLPTPTTTPPPPTTTTTLNSNFLFSNPDGCHEFLHSTFLEVDSRLESNAGSTATVLLVEKSQNGELVLQVANVGDSLGILINIQSGRIIDLTADHRVVNEVEKRRLLEMKAPLSMNNTRLCMLNLARAMGDTNLKKMDVGLLADPYISPVIHLPSNKDHLIVIASDGLWDFVRKQEVASLAMQITKDWEGVRAFGNALIKLTSQKRGPTDDISLFVARV